MCLLCMKDTFAVKLICWCGWKQVIVQMLITTHLSTKSNLITLLLLDISAKVRRRTEQRSQMVWYSLTLFFIFSMSFFKSETTWLASGKSRSQLLWPVTSSKCQSSHHKRGLNLGMNYKLFNQRVIVFFFFWQVCFIIKTIRGNYKPYSVSDPL